MKSEEHQEQLMFIQQTYRMGARSLAQVSCRNHGAMDHGVEVYG